MTYRTLISAAALEPHLDEDDWVVVDARFSLEDPAWGRAQYELAHIPGAVYAHLDEDLSAPVVANRTGRHPLPDVTALEATFGQWGIDSTVQVVAYDRAGGAFASRVWWLLRWLGHAQVAVLDGGWQAWLEHGGPVRSGSESKALREFEAHLRPELVVAADDVKRLTSDPDAAVFDSRSADRYRGENETIDPVAGHIPDARSLPYADNLQPTGRFKSPQALRERFAAALGDVAPERTVFYCGSGVTAAQNLLAMQHAGIGEGRLYAGSWSHWITDPARPVALGDGERDEDQIEATQANSQDQTTPQSPPEEDR